MNREIEFRGKRVDNGEWVYGYYWTNEVDNHFIRVTKTETGLFVIKDYEVDGKTVGQYTGFKDKNRKEIYEGDIVFAIATYDCANMVVVWDDGGFVLVPCKYYKNYISRCGYKDIRFLDKEIIGNIYESPELIKEENNGISK